MWVSTRTTTLYGVLELLLDSVGGPIAFLAAEWPADICRELQVVLVYSRHVLRRYVGEGNSGLARQF